MRHHFFTDFIYKKGVCIWRLVTPLQAEFYQWIMRATEWARHYGPVLVADGGRNALLPEICAILLAWEGVPVILELGSEERVERIINSLLYSGVRVFLLDAEAQGLSELAFSQKDVVVGVRSINVAEAHPWNFTVTTGESHHASHVSPVFLEIEAKRLFDLDTLPEIIKRFHGVIIKGRYSEAVDAARRYLQCLRKF